MFIAVGIIALYTVAITNLVIPKINKDIQTLEEKSAKEILNKIATISKNVSKDLESYKKNALQNHKDELKNLTDTVYLFLKMRYEYLLSERNSTLTSNAVDIAKTDDIIEMVGKLLYDKDNYFFILGYDSKIIAHPLLKKGHDLSKVKDVKGNLFAPQIINIAKEKGEGFISYWWKKNKEDDTPYQKLSFVKNLPILHAVIGTGVYIDDIDKELKKRKKELLQQLRDIIKYTKIGKTGYVYIFDDNANMLIHPNDNINGKNFANTKNPSKNSNIFDDLIDASKKSKVLYYKWDKPSDKGNYIYNKVSWIEYIPELKWYIVSSAYVDDFQEAANEMRNFILLIAFVIVLISILLSLIFFRHLLKPISNLAALTREVKNGNYSIRSDYKSDDEIGILSDAFNNMLDTIKNNMDTLDMKVKQRTKDLQKTQEELKKLAITDPMTKLYNRRYYASVSLELLALAKRNEQEIGVIMIDIDKFKNINDTYGHSIGDEVIIALAEVLLENARDGDIAFRFGGEEFVMLLPNTDIEGAKTLAEKIRKILEKLNMASADDKVFNFTVSIGVSSVALSSECNTEKAIIRSDKALYEAKQSGRNRVCLNLV